MAIKFYGKEDTHWEFSNFYVRPIEIAGILWPVGTEQYFQAMKSVDPGVHEYIRTQLTRPGQIKNYCSSSQIDLRPDWEEIVSVAPTLAQSFTDAQGVVVERVKDHFMFQGLIAKYTQHADLRALLLGTGDQDIIENTQKVGADPYWGNGPSANGLNKLGRMLMLIRANLRRRA